MKRTGVLLLNLGTPDRPDPASVGGYLREFLMDRHVVDIPAPFRWILVHQLIVPRRSVASASAYRQIWTERGSPLKFHSEDLAAAVRARIGSEFDVRFAMRYQNPSIASAFAGWQDAALSEIRVMPLYPQYARASTLSSEEAVAVAARKAGVSAPLKFLRPFYGDSGFLDAFARRTKATLAEGPWDHVLFSFHGLPERQIRPTDLTNDLDYRAHCSATARGIAERLGIPAEKWSLSFQSRLGRTKWIEPYTDLVLPELAARGVKNVVVVCPAFVADCLETLEEIGIRAVELFRKAGGSGLRLVPSLNAEPDWADAVVKLAKTGPFR